MLNFLLVNLLLVIFLLSIIGENKFIPTIKQIERLKKSFPGTYIFALIMSTIVLLFLAIFKEQTFVRSYLLFSFGFLVMAHTIWISLLKSTKVLFFSLFSAFSIIFYRVFFPSQLSHNLLLFFALFWLGSFLVTIGLLNTKRLIVISMLWFLYDIFYVWLSSTSHIVHATTNAIGFPLAISVGISSIGTADLLWAGLFLSILKTTKLKIIGGILLVVSNLLLGLYSFTTNNFSGFPLLVLWVPIAIICIGISYRKRSVNI